MLEPSSIYAWFPSRIYILACFACFFTAALGIKLNFHWCARKHRNCPQNQQFRPVWTAVCIGDCKMFMSPQYRREYVQPYFLGLIA